MERERHPGRVFPGFRHSASKDARERAYGSTRVYEFASITGRAMAETMIGLPLRRRIDMEVDHADAALLEHVDALGDRRGGVGRTGHGADADRALCLRELGDVGHWVLQAQSDPAVLDLAAARASDAILVQL